MRKVALGGILGLWLASLASPQDTGDKRELRYKFEKGEKVVLVIKQKMNVKLDEVPEAFQGIAPEEPFDNDFDGTAEFEVKEAGEKGYVLEGRFQTIQAKGSVIGQDFEFAYDRAKDGDEPKGGGDEGGGGDGGMPGGLGNPADMLRGLAVARLKLEIDPLGKFKIGGADGGSGAVATQLLDLGGLIGQLPKDKVGAGDTWKNSDSLELPGLPFKMRVKSENKFTKTEKIEGQECALIESKFTVGTEGGDADKEEEPPMDLPIPLKAKFTGEGKGSMAFAMDAGRPVKNDMKMDVKLTVTISNPQGGDDVEIKGRFKMEQTLGIKKKDY